MNTALVVTSERVDAADLLVVDFAGERAAAEEAALAALAPATRRAYKTDWSAWSAWCAARGYDPLPAPAAALAMYLPHAALTLKGLRPVVAPFTTRRLDVRDRAILLLGYAAAMRRSEIVALNVGDLTFAPEGVSVMIRRSKTDKRASACCSACRSARTPKRVPCVRCRRGSRCSPTPLRVRRCSSRLAAGAWGRSRREHRAAPLRSGRAHRRLRGSQPAQRLCHDGGRQRRRRARNLESDSA